MTQRYDIISPRPGKDGKPRWVRIGTGWERDKGGFSLNFDALPLPDAEGKVTVLMTIPQDRQDGPAKPRGNASQAAEFADNSEIPF